MRGLGHIVAVKTTWEDLPFADCCVGLDIPWQKRDTARLIELARRMPLYLNMEDRPYNIGHDCPPIPGAIYIKQTRICDRLHDDPTLVEAGGNSGFAALGVTYHKRPPAIVFFGFDYGGSPYEPGRYAHQKPGQNERYMTGWAEYYRHTVAQLTAARITVLNASPNSRIPCFTRITHDAAFDFLHRFRQQGA